MSNILDPNPRFKATMDAIKDHVRTEHGQAVHDYICRGMALAHTIDMAKKAIIGQDIIKKVMLSFDEISNNIFKTDPEIDVLDNIVDWIRKEHGKTAKSYINLGMAVAHSACSFDQGGIMTCEEVEEILKNFLIAHAKLQKKE